MDSSFETLRFDLSLPRYALCLLFATRVNMTTGSISSWSSTQDEKLLTLAKPYLESGKKIDWKDVKKIDQQSSNLFSNFSPCILSQRWERSLNPELKRSPWTEEDHLTFANLYHKTPKDENQVYRIQDAMKRPLYEIYNAIRSFENYGQLQKLVRWTPEELNTLEKMVKANTNWQTIFKAFPNRTPRAVQAQLQWRKSKWGLSTVVLERNKRIRDDDLKNEERDRCAKRQIKANQRFQENTAAFGIDNIDSWPLEKLQTLEKIVEKNTVDGNVDWEPIRKTFPDHSLDEIRIQWLFQASVKPSGSSSFGSAQK